jgi:aspartyl-tRNA(Asn)/glutamyl-tRNA(Gln) amidotransferase subunit C
MYSRKALMANPSRYAKIAGLLIGPDVTAKQLNTLDLARSLHNEGRLVATAGNPKVLDRHMFSVAHMHLGKRGVILRREAVPLGRMVHAYPQIREAIITHSKVGGAKRLSEAASFPKARRTAAANAALATYTGQLERILEYVAHLEQVDTEGVPPTTRAVEVVNVTRDDVVVPTEVREDLLNEAPLREGDFFRVPKILAD